MAKNADKMPFVLRRFALIVLSATALSVAAALDLTNTLDELGGVFARLLAAFATADVPGLPSPHGLGFSMGGVEAADGTDFSALLAEADRRLYAAIAAGRSTWR